MPLKAWSADDYIIYDTLPANLARLIGYRRGRISLKKHFKLLLTKFQIRFRFIGPNKN